MGVYTRFKRSPDGFRALVELLETTPESRRKRMIEVGMAEDPAFTQSALKYVLGFDDIAALPDLELAEVVAKAPPKMTAFALSASPEETRQRFLRNAKPRVAAEIRDYLEVKVGAREISGARIKVIEAARQLERAGYLKTKRIPASGAA